MLYVYKLYNLKMTLFLVFRLFEKRFKSRNIIIIKELEHYEEN